MKTFFIASSLAIAAMAAPQIAAAQDQQSEPEITVTAKYQKDWNKGNRLEAEGLQEIASAKRELVKQSAAVVNAQNLRDTSQARADNARAAFESLTARPYFSDAGDAHKWAKQVEKAASDWAKFESKQNDGVKALSKAQKRQSDAQKTFDKAQAKVDKGKLIKFEAEQASRLQVGG